MPKFYKIYIVYKWVFVCEYVDVCRKSSKSPISDGDCKDLDDIPSQTQTKFFNKEEEEGRECVLWTHEYTHTNTITCTHPQQNNQDKREWNFLLGINKKAWISSLSQR